MLKWPIQIPSAASRSGFTRVELLSVISVLAVLLMLRISAGTDQENKTATSTCLYNLRQLTRAWQLYADDNRGIVADNNFGSPTVWAKNAISLNDPGNIPPAALTNTPFGKYVARADFFHCPAHHNSVRTSAGIIDGIRTYSMNAAVGAGSATWLPSPAYRTYTNLASMTTPSPSRLFVFIEEHPDSINDGSFALIMPSSPTTTELIDFPAGFHGYSAGLSFADGHVEMKHWIDSRTSPSAVYSLPNPNFNRPTPNNPDVLWLAERTSSRRQ